MQTTLLVSGQFLYRVPLTKRKYVAVRLVDKLVNSYILRIKNTREMRKLIKQAQLWPVIDI
jgi:hypothetical protein